MAETERGSIPMNFTPSGPPNTVVPAPPADMTARLAAAAAAGTLDRDTAAGIVADYPAVPLAWAELGDRGRDAVERYAAYRVGYHRGLDLLRQSGWRGSGYVRWSEPSNRGFLRCLRGLAHSAAEIGETSEVDRCRTFLDQLDSSWAGRHDSPDAAESS